MNALFRRFSNYVPIVLALAFPLLVNAQFTFVTNNGTLTITRYNGPPVAVIPASTNGMPITAIAPQAFQFAYSISIPSTVTNIGTNALAYVSPALTNITVDAANPVYSSSLDG